MVAQGHPKRGLYSAFHCEIESDMRISTKEPELLYINGRGRSLLLAEQRAGFEEFLSHKVEVAKFGRGYVEVILGGYVQQTGFSAEMMTK